MKNLSKKELEAMFDALEDLNTLGRIYGALAKKEKDKRVSKLFAEVSGNIQNCLGDIAFVTVEDN